MNFEIVRPLLAQKKIKEEYLNSIREIFERADMARFASSNVTQDVMAEDLKKLQTVIEHLEDEI